MDQTLEGIHGNSQDEALPSKLLHIKYHDGMVNRNKRIKKKRITKRGTKKKKRNSRFIVSNLEENMPAHKTKRKSNQQLIFVQQKLFQRVACSDLSPDSHLYAVTITKLCTMNIDQFKKKIKLPHASLTNSMI